jgi:hypothetical protein
MMSHCSGGRQPQGKEGSPGHFHPIEQVFAKLKALLRKAEEKQLKSHGSAWANYSTISNPTSAQTTPKT